MLREVLLSVSSIDTAAAPATTARQNGPTGTSLDSVPNSPSGTHSHQPVETYKQAGWQTLQACRQLSTCADLLSVRANRNAALSTKPAQKASSRASFSLALAGKLNCPMPTRSWEEELARSACEGSGGLGGGLAGAHCVWPVCRCVRRKERGPE